MATYKLELPISTKIFNFNQFFNTLDLDGFLQNPEILSCNCDRSPYDKHHEHFVAGDLRIIKHNILRKLFAIEKATNQF